MVLLKTENIKTIKYVVSVLTVYTALVGHTVNAQSDTLKNVRLKEVTVKAYESNHSLLESSATVAVLDERNLERFSPTTFVNAVNTLPGVRMEERSPGSYRFSIRGSMLRSPFGIRNVKFYWNGIPFTDANGNTPVNSLDFGSVRQMEVIKGPGSSLYGAGTGGVVLLSTSGQGASRHNYAEQAFGIGKYGFLSYNTDLRAGGVSIQYGHQQQDGYRQQSAMVRDAITFSSSGSLGEKGTLSLLGTYSDLHYQTPGGINLSQYQTNPTWARQSTATVPGSVEQKAGIYTKYLFIGGSYQLPLSSSWNQTLSFYFSGNDFANPFITNYEKRDESGIGGRNFWQNTTEIVERQLVWTSGFEWQYGKSVQRTFENQAGEPGEQQTSEDLKVFNLALFSQAELFLTPTTSLSAGLSYSSLRYNFEQYFPAPYTSDIRKFDGEFSPRIALNQRWGDTWAVFGSVSNGFSPPTLQEVRPSAGGFRRDLEAEKGTNSEVGLRRTGERLTAEITFYRFKLKDAIVRRSDESGAEYFINAGKTDQNGVEWRFDYNLIQGGEWIKLVKLWQSGTFSNYVFKNFKQADVNLSGNRLPGIPRFNQNLGTDLLLKGGFGLHVVYQHTGKFYLNDANSVESTPVDQWVARASWKKFWGNHLYSELSASAERVKADVYSLGFDLNAFGNRYYNSAPKSNAWAGVKLGWEFRK